jgi:hypothetical protein
LTFILQEQIYNRQFDTKKADKHVFDVHASLFFIKDSGLFYQTLTFCFWDALEDPRLFISHYFFTTGLFWCHFLHVLFCNILNTQLRGTDLSFTTPSCQLPATAQ